ncbi:glutathione S-transferase omega-1-like isoform X1 [Hypanus sabinus]|uniref:glutathione S-transferase omega-1-like isoform X1 n=1 Tax=Hypanus sabinus TaxID=79690 RepID=UPI0028C4562D|nr:glutathione S-transferase omega-1-like isoform X1 [Hypanus sabinus]
MSAKALAKGSPAPGSVPEGMIRLYSMKYCPFAQRTRLVLEAKGIKYETININLISKPDWFFEKNPIGLVPVLETCANQLIYESPITCVFLDECYPGRQLLPADPYGKAKQSMLLEHFRTFPSCIYKIAVAKGKSEDTSTLEEEFQAHLSRLEQHLAESKTPFFGGDQVTMVDYMLWPWFERLEAFSFSEFLDRTPALRSWMQAMMKDPAVKATAIDTAAHRGFYKLYRQRSLEACDYTP